MDERIPGQTAARWRDVPVRGHLWADSIFFYRRALHWKSIGLKSGVMSEKCGEHCSLCFPFVVSLFLTPQVSFVMNEWMDGNKFVLGSHLLQGSQKLEFCVVKDAMAENCPSSRLPM